VIAPSTRPDRRLQARRDPGARTPRAQGRPLPVPRPARARARGELVRRVPSTDADEVRCASRRCSPSARAWTPPRRRRGRPRSRAGSQILTDLLQLFHMIRCSAHRAGAPRVGARSAAPFGCATANDPGRRRLGQGEKACSRFRLAMGPSAAPNRVNVTPRI
jgi:hypothetical protein